MNAIRKQEIIDRIKKAERWNGRAHWADKSGIDPEIARELLLEISGLEALIDQLTRSVVIDLPPDTPADELEYIRSLTREERRERLRDDRHLR